MELQKLRYFYAVAKFQHMTKAAEYISIAQPALSQAIKSLENELQVELFVKKGRNIVLTEYGLYLKERLETILPEIDSIPAEIDKMKKRVSKTVKLNILAASAFVINAIVEYRKNHPDAVFDFEQNEQRTDCDIVISTNGLTHSSLVPSVNRCVKTERIYLAVPKNSSYSPMESIELRDVRDEEFVMLSNARLFGVICNEFCSKAGFYPKILFESDSPTAVQNIISTGTGVAFWPEYSWGELNNDNVVLLPVKTPVCSRELIIELYETLPRSEYAEDFYNFLLQQISDNE
ncbi:MAG: LysR family transcriptional regulator [Ruminococcus sp.]|nr:LysR family transcriptional regulator [Ruminococcus sp.]